MRCVEDYASADAASILCSALDGDGNAVTGVFDKVVDRGGVDAAYNVAWRLAAAMVGDGLERGPWRLDFPNIDGAGYDARWVARFISAYVNEDEPTGVALFGVAIEDGMLPECLLMLAGSTAATLRHRAQGSGC
ncbi:MAG: hypothetical protein HKP61_01400 [Dactylosporangium sp.]|nr:hypothetical protein [Dactylosporangium sp.]NNJ59620.1 hypothetical protein [Dactylosporangium sp.]